MSTPPRQDDSPDLLAEADHDLRSPIRRIAAFAELLERDLGPNISADARYALSVIRSNAKRSQGVVEALRQLNEARRTPLDPQETSLEALIDGVLAGWSHELTNRSVTIHRGPLPARTLDAHWLRRALDHLVGNALQYGGASLTRIDIRWDEAGQVLAFADDGPGIEPQFRAQVQRPFKRLHPWHELEGHGLGLALCTTVAERHGGDLAVVESELGGTAVLMRLPQISAPGRDLA